MYGNVDYYIAMEIARFINKWSKEQMDPFTFHRLSVLRQQEILEEAARDRNVQVVRPLLRRLGSFFVTIGEKLVEANDPEMQRYPSLENEACV